MERTSGWLLSIVLVCTGGQKKNATPNRWNKWEKTSPWVPWVKGKEPKSDTEWNRQWKQHISNILRTQEADIDHRENDNQDGDELGSVSSADEEEN